MAVLLDYQHVEVSFNGEPVVHDVSFQLHPGEILGLVGESGSGKSTLIKAAMGLLGSSGMVTRGDIWFEGKSLPDVPPKELRRICGEKIGLLGNRKLEDGNLCKDCAKKLSPWFSERRNSTVSEIKEQLAYREKNRERAAQFRTARSYGEDWKLLLDEEHRWFTVTRARDLADANLDILDYTALTGCRVDIDESRTEQMREDADGKEISYVPPRYEYSYDFDIIISVSHPYFDEMRFRLNDSSVYIEPQSTVQRPMMGQRPMAGQMQRPMAGQMQRPMPGQMQRPMAGRPQPMGRPMMGQTMNVAPVNFDPENSMEYRKYREMGDEIRAALLQVMETARGGGAVQTAPMQQEAPMQQQETFAPAPAAAGPWTCPACGGQNDGKFCEYCGAPRA